MSLVVEVSVHGRHLGGAGSDSSIWSVFVGMDSLVADELSTSWSNVFMEMVASTGCVVTESLVCLVWESSFVNKWSSVGWGLWVLVCRHCVGLFRFQLWIFYIFIAHMIKQTSDVKNIQS